MLVLHPSNGLFESGDNFERFGELRGVELGLANNLVLNLSGLDQLLSSNGS